MSIDRFLPDAEYKAVMLHCNALPLLQYPYQKPVGHFEEDKKIELPDSDARHTVTLSHKKHKPTGSPLQNANGWLLLQNSAHKKNLKEVIYRFILATGDNLRFLLGNLQPKYRIMRNAKGCDILQPLDLVK